MKITVSAGMIETRNVSLQPMTGVKIPPTREARITPTGAPDCMNAPNLALRLSGKVSLMYVWPVAHSPPTPKPVMSLKSTNE